VELSDPYAFSDLIGKRVRDRSGHSLGRILEARAHRDVDGTVVIDELLIGRRALLDRLRGPHRDARGIPWSAVVELGEDVVVLA